MDAFQRYSTTSSGAAMGDPGQGSTSTSNGGGGGRRRRRSREIEALSVEIRKYPRDLFHSFLSTESIKAQKRLNRSASEEQEDGGIELNLGLSLGGRFGVDKSNGGLIRASSIAGMVPTYREVLEPAAVNAAALPRTASLPVETEEEWRRRKAMQTLRRMEAKRRRSEKQRSIKENNSNGTGEERERQQLGVGVPGKLSPNPGPGPGPGYGLVGQWGGSSRQGSGGFEAAGMKGKGGFFGSLQGLLTQQVPQQQLQGCSQGSGESYGGGSSGVSELESKTNQGSGSYGEARSPASTHSMQVRGSREASPVGSSSSTKYAEGSTSKHPETPDHKKKDAAAAAPGGIEDMPCVFTIGDGPNGRKVEGILYKYGKGEEVRIMCVCHGSFFSPAEFVKHAGGCDVEHPLRHIVVNPSPSAF